MTSSSIAFSGCYALHAGKTLKNLKLHGSPPFSIAHSGTTAAVVLYRDDRAWVANAGDSRVVLGTEKREDSADGGSAEVEPSVLASTGFICFSEAS